MLKIGFERSKFDSYVYVKKVEDSMVVYLLLYVDNILIASKSKSEKQVVKVKLQKEFKMKELGNARRILGIEIERDKRIGCCSCLKSHTFGRYYRDSTWKIQGLC